METKTSDTPELRFPEFSGEWIIMHGNDLFEQISNKNHNSDLPILAITQDQGAVPREMIDYNVSVTDASVASYKVVEFGDFIISLRSFQGGIEYSNYKGICSPAYIILRKKTDNVCNDFYKYFFKTKRYISELTKNLEGIRDGKMISYKQFSETKLPLPKLPEQCKIAACLSSLDSLIKSICEKIDLLKQHKKGLMQKLFPKRGSNVPELRFDGFEGEWHMKTLGTVAKRITRKNHENNQNVLTISAQNGLISQFEFFNKNVAPNDVTKYFLIKKGEFAYNKSRSQEYDFGAIKQLKKYDKGVVSVLYICFKINDDYDSNYFEYFFETKSVQMAIGKIAQEGARNHGLLNISVTDFFKIPVWVPTIAEQRTIASCLSSIDNEIAIYEVKQKKMQEHKQGLMQKLFVKIR